MYTVPNQRVVTIHKEKCEKNFLQIKKENIANALRTLKHGRIAYPAVILYLYFAANAEGFHLAYSPQAVEKEFGLPKSSCDEHFNTLVEHGYLVQRKDGSNQYDFYETPQKPEINF